MSFWRFLFLDIDGVLNSTRSVIAKIGPNLSSPGVAELMSIFDQDETIAHGYYGAQEGLLTADPVCVALLNRLFEQDPEMGLVLSSTHRGFFCGDRTPYGSPEHLRRLKLYLQLMGIKVPSYFSITPKLYKKRGLEVESWVNMAYENGLIDDDDRYVIFDDHNDMLPGQPFIRTDPRHGLDFDNYGEACKLLGLKEPGLILI